MASVSGPFPCLIEALLQQATCLEVGLQEFATNNLGSQLQISDSDELQGPKCEPGLENFRHSQELQTLRSLISKQEIQLDSLHSDNLRVHALLAAQTKELDAARAENAFGTFVKRSDELDSKQISTASKLSSFKSNHESFGKSIEQVNAGLMRRANIDKLIEDAFIKLNPAQGSEAGKSLQKQDLYPMLKELGLYVSEEEAEELSEEFDSDQSKALDLDELKLLLQKPTRIHEWVKSLPLVELVVDAISSFLPKKTRDQHSSIDPLLVVSELSPEERRSACAAVLYGMERVLEESCAELYAAFHPASGPGDGKPKHIGKFCGNIEVMAAGDIRNFHAGIEARIGAPNLKFFQAMELEHKDEEEFETPNYHVKTCPLKEWHVVVDQIRPEGEEQVPREVKDVDELTQEYGLRREEVVAVVLYTGPMYVKYNKALRQQGSTQPAYGTTIYVLNAAVLAIARRTKLATGTKLYRGLGGDRKFPPTFYKSDPEGRRGMLEWGFMSTTADKSVAVQYSGVMEGKAYAAILEIDAGTVDRGADISAFSQYPREKECLFPPCSFLEPMGGDALELTKADGATRIVRKVRVRINANLKARSLSELEEAKKSMHITAFRYLISELERELRELAGGGEAEERRKSDRSSHSYENERDGKTITREGTVEALCDGIVEDCCVVLTKHEELPAADFLDDCMYRYLVAESLETKEMGKYKFLLWLRGTEDAGDINARKTLKQCHREWNLLLQQRLAAIEGDERARAALELCRSTCLVRAEIEERNNFGETPLMRAAADGESDFVLELLFYARADVNAKSTDDGFTALHLAAAFDRTAAIGALAGIGADTNARSGDGRTPLHAAARGGQVSAIETLVRLGAATDLQGRYGFTPLHEAAVGRKVSAIETLGRLGANVAAQDEDGWTPLHCAANVKCIAAIEALVRLGASLEVRDNEGKTPLDRACGDGDTVAALRQLAARRGTEARE